MLVPLTWLREFVPYGGTAQALGDKLTMLGLELEDIVNPFADISGIVVGYVAQCELHPDSDHLHCCKVDIGAGQLLDIVCGAPNVAQGQKVAVAPVGCKLPDGTTIKKAKLRGQPSQGMICSERELGLSDDHSGIMVLSAALEVGQTLVRALDMDTEVLDISVTPNRSDCLSIIGIARETAMAFKLPFAVPELPLIFSGSEEQKSVPVQIDDPRLCWLYSGRIINGITMGASPARLRYRLIAVGVRPISNIVDITNYILMECGQPLHAFDLDKVAGVRIIVRCARDGEKFTTLDGKERTLCSHDLCICDAERAIGLAGVMGGLNTEITDTSKNVFLESAVFDPVTIRRTSRRLGLASEAAYRFERGIDQSRTIWSLNRACSLMASICGGIVHHNFSCEEPRPFIPKRIPYKPARASALLGVKLDDVFQKTTLEELGCAVENEETGLWNVIQPAWRPDLTRAADLIEEVGRVYGLDAIEPQLPPVQRSLDDILVEESQFSFWNHIKNWGAGIGLNEAINYSFVGQDDLDLLNMPKDNRISICNPLSEEQNVLRTCLAPGLLHDLANNLAYGAQSVRLFELANTFFADNRSETGAKESGALGILLYGLRHEPHWPYKEANLDYADMKGLVENLLQYLHIPPAKYENELKHPFLLPCARVEVKQDTLGYIGRIKPEIADASNAQKDVWYAELDLEILHRLYCAETRQFKALPVYPPVRRDMTVMAAANIKVDEILENILLMKLPLLEGATLVDCFEPENSEERHLTFRLTFRHGNRTLKDAEVDKEREKVAESLRSKMNVRI